MVEPGTAGTLGGRLPWHRSRFGATGGVAPVATDGSATRSEKGWPMILRRIGLAILMIWMTVTATFFIVRLMPGNPATFELHVLIKRGVPYNMALQRVTLLYGINLHQSLWTQYGHYVSHALHGNFGNSLLYPDVPVMRLIGKALPWTVFTVGMALLLSFVIGVALGTYAAYRRHGWLDKILTPTAAVLNGIPNYLTGTILLFVFGVVLGWFPQNGPYSASITPGFSLSFLVSVARHAVLPITAYVLSQWGGWYLLMKGSTVSTLGKDYIVGARSFGIRPNTVMKDYVAPNSILPMFTNLVLSIGFMFGGSVFVESIFSYPGVGYLFGSSVSGRDYPMMQGLFAILTVAIILSNLLADLVYVRLDPRISLEDVA